MKKGKVTRHSKKRLQRARLHEIIESCANILLAKGYSNTSIRDLAKAANLTVGGLYYYINSKEELLRLMYLRALELERPMLASFEKDVPDDKLLVSLIKSWCNIADEIQSYIIFNYREIKSLPRDVRDTLLDQESEIAPQVFRRLLAKGIEEGIFRNVNIEALAFVLYTLGHIWALGRWYLRNVISLEEYSELVADVTLNGIKKRSEPNGFAQRNHSRGG